MSEHMSGSAFSGEKSDRDPLAPATSGLAFIADYMRLFPRDEVVTPEMLAKLRSLTDRIINGDDVPALPEYVAVDPDLRVSVAPYPPIRSEQPPLTQSELAEQVRAIYGQPPAQE